MLDYRHAKNVFFGCLALAAYYGFVKNTGWGFPCPIRYFFHLECPGCGITRMLLACLDGDFSLAYASNPVLFVLSPFLLWLLFRSIKGYLYSQAIVWKKWESTGMAFALMILMAFSVVRNLPGM